MARLDRNAGVGLEVSIAPSFRLGRVTFCRTKSMLSLARSSGGLPLKGFALALGISVLFGSSVMADGDGHADFAEGRFKPKYLGEGTLGWAEYGLYPGLYGFSLRWHPGYGYGLYALGVGADGGYPFYGGPGYPHPWPQLRRFGPATPFAYYGGPDWPRDRLCNYYAGIGGLAIEKPVVTIGEPGDLGYVNEAGDVATRSRLWSVYRGYSLSRDDLRALHVRGRDHRFIRLGGRGQTADSSP